jgi:hypothetical protein
MKKHHLFLLIVCLLLVASLAFPIGLPRSTNHSIIYEVSDVNDFPGKIVEGDTLYIKKFMDQLSEKENKQIRFTISKKTIGQAPTAIPFDNSTAWIKGSVDEVAQEYYTSPPLSPGTYNFLINSIRTSGSATLEKAVVTNREVEVIPKKNLVEVQKIREGDDHT